MFEADESRMESSLKEKFCDVRRQFDNSVYFFRQWTLFVPHIAWVLPDIVYIHWNY